MTAEQRMAMQLRHRDDKLKDIQRRISRLLQSIRHAQGRDAEPRQLVGWVAAQLQAMQELHFVADATDTDISSLINKGII